MDINSKLETNRKPSSIENPIPIMAATAIENPRTAIILEPYLFTSMLAKKIPASPPTANSMVKIPISAVLRFRSS